MSENPDLIVDLPESRPGLHGTLDVFSGHVVNHVIIGDLGNEEILIAACDDGDVISYTTRSISLAIEQATCLGEPWFLQNVGSSAWGLAIHKDARLIAVSSNTKRIEVFAPALKRSESPDSRLNETDGFEEFTNSAGSTMPPNHWTSVLSATPNDRVYNRKIILDGHATNIPNIAFCNTGLDREGRYLASTDIENKTFIWDVYRGVTLLEHYGNLTTGRLVSQTSNQCLSTDHERPARMGCRLSKSFHFKTYP